MRVFNVLAAVELLAPLLSPFEEMDSTQLERYARAVWETMGEFGFERRPFYVPSVVTWVQQSGFYCPDNQTVIVPSGDLGHALAHELCHAYQPGCCPGMEIPYMDPVSMAINRDLYFTNAMENQAFMIQIATQLLSATGRRAGCEVVRREWEAAKSGLLATLPEIIEHTDNPLSNALIATATESA